MFQWLTKWGWIEFSVLWPFSLLQQSTQCQVQPAECTAPQYAFYKQWIDVCWEYQRGRGKVWEKLFHWNNYTYLNIAQFYSRMLISYSHNRSLLFPETTHTHTHTHTHFPMKRNHSVDSRTLAGLGLVLHNLVVIPLVSRWLEHGPGSSHLVLIILYLVLEIRPPLKLQAKSVS